MSEFLIIGGGVIGLLVARELAAAGAKVTVVEQGGCCQESSWAGGGIVSPLYPWRYSPAVTALASQAQLAYPRLAAQLLDETGIDPELERTGLLMLDAKDEDEALQWAVTNGKALHPVDPAFIYEREAGLAQGFLKGLWMPDIANIRNPRLGQALQSSLQRNPLVHICEQTRVLSLHTGTGFGHGARSVSHVEVLCEGVVERLAAEHVIITAGAWTGGLLEALDVILPVVPVKGQMLLFRPPQRLINTMVLTDGRYLIPRRDNNLLMGSTLEHTAFDKSTTEEALRSLRRSAEALLPALAECRVERQWAGLRPGAPDGVPFIGRVPGFENVYVNAGQYRNGLVLAPASAQLLVDIVLGRRPSVDPKPYDPVSRNVMVRDSPRG
ncbi:MAG: glycine oxidase ThiO [Gammaproteobacteria bacterium]|nr:glycine oxidase ThiO [Gammaproteobacteria bacterium]